MLRRNNLIAKPRDPAQGGDAKCNWSVHSDKKFYNNYNFRMILCPISNRGSSFKENFYIIGALRNCVTDKEMKQYFNTSLIKIFLHNSVHMIDLLQKNGRLHSFL